MELRQLKYFLAVADTRSFVSAANNLFLSRQAVSKAISQLEAELNVELFMRDSNGAFLTPAGMIFYERVRGTVLELEQLEKEMRQHGSQFHQVIRIAFAVGTLLPYEKQLVKFIHQQKNIIVEYREYPPDQCLGLLRDRQVDLAICTCSPEDDSMRAQILLESPFGVLLKEQEQLDNLDQVELQDLLWLPLACFSDGQSDKLCRENHLNPQYTGIDLVRLITMAEEGLCATLMPKCLLPKYMHNIQWIPLAAPEPWRIYQVNLRSSENNIMFHTAMDELLLRVFHRQPE